MEDTPLVQSSFPRQTDPLRITFCLPFIRETGSKDTSILQQMLIAQELTARGHRLQFVAPAKMEVVHTEGSQEPQPVLRTWTNMAWFRLASSASWKMQQLLRIPYLNFFSNWRYYDSYLQCFPGQDIVHERNGLFRMAAAMACRQLGLPYVLFFDGDDVLELNFQGQNLSDVLMKRAKFIIRHNLQSADRVICVSNTAKTRLSDFWRVPGDKIEVFPNGVDTNLFSPNAAKAAQDREAHGLSLATVMIYVGSFYPWQDTETLLKAFAAISKENPQAYLIMVGDGQKYRETVDLANFLGISSSIRFTGFLPQEEVSRLVNLAHIALAPYVKMDPKHFIGSPMKLFEYMACAKAVIATDLGQISEVIINGQNGFRVEPGNPDALADAMLTLLRDPELCKQMGEQARIDAVEKFSWQGYTLRLEKLYRLIIDEKREIGSKSMKRRVKNAF